MDKESSFKKQADAVSSISKLQQRQFIFILAFYFKIGNHIVIVNCDLIAITMCLGIMLDEL